MKNLYNITKGQFITIWVFGVLVWIGTSLTFLDSEGGVAGFLAVFIPFVLIFYTFGWRNNRNKPTNDFFNELEKVRKEQGYTTVNDVARAAEKTRKGE